jgi:drug/metabolite transporter (DMT)-like permease
MVDRGADHLRSGQPNAGSFLFLPGNRINPGAFTYFEIVAAVAIGYLMFGTLPIWISWLGIFLITLSGYIVARSLPGREAPQRGPKI